MTSDDPRRERVRAQIAQLTGRAVRWCDARLSLGDFEGREHTLDVFDIPAAEQRDLNFDLRTVRRKASALFDAPVSFVFHTPEETSRLYAWVRSPDQCDSASAAVVRLSVGSHIGTGPEVVDLPGWAIRRYVPRREKAA